MKYEEMKRRVLDYVCWYTDTHGYAPTYREIGAGVGLKSISTVSYYIQRLKEEGNLDMKAKSPRALCLNRRIPIKAEEPQRLRVELADGGVFFVDCTIKGTGKDDLAIVLSGVMDGSHMRGNIGSIVGCTVYNE